MKSIVVLGIIGLIILLIYIRLRPAIRAARQIFGVARDVRRVVRDQPGTSSTSVEANDKLIRCGGCDIWFPTSRAVKLRGSSASFCSHACLEAVADGRQRKAV